MLTAIAHPIMTPQFLQQQGVKDWLAIQQVRDDLKALATRQLLGNTTPDAETRKRLIDAYTLISTNPAATAIEATNGIVAVLVAGHQASLETNPATVAGFIQAASTENRGAFERVSEQVSSVAERLNSIGPDALVVRVHTEQASEELTGILKRRSFRTEEARDQIQALVEKLFSEALRHADRAVKAQAHGYWEQRSSTFLKINTSQRAGPISINYVSLSPDTMRESSMPCF